jgi:hypothetical protein
MFEETMFLATLWRPSHSMLSALGQVPMHAHPDPLVAVAGLGRDRGRTGQPEAGEPRVPHGARGGCWGTGTLPAYWGR